MVIFLVGVEDGPGDDDTSVGREALTFGELGFRGRGAGFRSGSLLSHLCMDLASNLQMQVDCQMRKGEYGTEC